MAWLLSLSIMFSMFVHVVVCVRTSFLFMVEHSSGMEIDHIVFTCSSVDGHVGSFHFSVIVNSAAVNICVQGFLKFLFSKHFKLEYT